MVDSKLIKDINLPKYKLLKALNLLKNNIFAYKVLCNLLILMSPAKYFFDLIRLSILNLTSSPVSKNMQDLVVTDSEKSYKNFSRISDGFLESVDILHYKDLRSFSSFLAWEDILIIYNEIRIFRTHIKKISDNLTKTQYKELVLHSLDLVSVVAFVVILNKFNKSKKNIYFDQHIQRWAFLISHIIDSNKANLVQHGFLDASVSFTHAFGSINSASIVSNDFKSEFEKIYSIGSFKLLNTNLPIKYVEPSNKNITIFLASQPNSIELETIFIELCIRKNINCLIKLHPKYNYASAFHRFKNFSVIKFIKPDVFPDCDVMVSYNSFLGYEYRSLGYMVYFLVDYPSIEDMNAILDKTISL